MRIKRILLMTVFMAIGAAAAMAVPAKPGVKKILTLKDGTRVEATLKGDEHVHYYQTSDKRAIQFLDGGYQFVSRDSLELLHRRRLAARNQERMAHRRIGTVPEGGYRGQRKGLVIMVEFSDVKFTYGKDVFNDYFNKVGFDMDGMAGSVHDYFLEQSYGAFDLEFDIVGPVTLNNKAEYYGYDYATKAGQNQRVALMVNSLCRQVDNQVDFSKYDWDGDGTVDQVYVIYAGYGAAQGADHTIWPHEWTVRGGTSSPYKTAEGVTIDTYGISCELQGDGERNTGRIDGIGTSCHEFSHCLGLPDFYDTSEEQSNFGMSYWDLMDSGCYNGRTNGISPCGYTAYERWYAGWLTPVELSSSCQIADMPALQDEPVAYILYNDANHNEYYLLENYQNKGFDAAGVGHGLLVLHVDYDQSVWGTNSANVDANRQRMTIIAADNAYSTSNLSADPFPGTRRKTELTNTSTPRASLYNANVDGRKLMNKPITDISEDNGLIMFNFMGGVEVSAPIAREATDVTPTSFTAHWDAVDGATEYNISLSQTIIQDEEESFGIFEETFENFVAEKLSDDISASLDDYTTIPGWSGKNLYASKNKLRVGKMGAAGELLTPLFDAPVHDTLSIIIAPISASRLSQAELQLRIYSSAGNYMYGDLTEIPTADDESAGTAWVMMAPWSYGPFQIGIYPVDTGQGVYMDYLAAVDGVPSYEEEEEQAIRGTSRRAPRLAKGASHAIQWHSVGLDQPVHRPRRVSRVTTTLYTTSADNYTFTDLEPAIYSYKVRAITAEGVSPWSDEVSVDLSDAIQSVAADKQLPTDGRTYMLDGRPAQGRNLRPGIYIRDARKVVIR